MKSLYANYSTFFVTTKLLPNLSVGKYRVKQKNRPLILTFFLDSNYEYKNVFNVPYIKN